MPSNSVYRIRQLASCKGREGLLPVGPATIWRWVRAGKFPAPYKLGAGTTVWDAPAVDNFLAERRSAGTAS